MILYKDWNSNFIFNREQLIAGTVLGTRFHQWYLYTNYVDKQGGRRVCQMSLLLQRLLLCCYVNLSTKGEGGQKSSKSCLRSLCMAPNNIPYSLKNIIIAPEMINKLAPFIICNFLSMPKQNGKQTPFLWIREEILMVLLRLTFPCDPCCFLF